MIYLIGAKLFGKKQANLAALIYGLSPWFVYLELTGSFYIVLLLIEFALFFLIILWKKSLNMFLLLFGLILFWFLRDQITVFSDIGLVNTVNNFRGETLGTPFQILSKVFENRYLYFLEHYILITLLDIWPTTFFIPYVGLLKLSYQPLIVTGLIIPFIFGIKEVLFKILNKKTFFLIFLLCLIPATLSNITPDVERLVLISPFIIFTICLGFDNLKTNKYYKFVYSILIILIVVQGLVIISDIYLRDPMRLYQLRYPL